MISSNTRQRVLQRIDAANDEIVKLLQDLVKIRSITGEEYEIQRFCEKTFNHMGLETDFWCPDVDELRKNPDFFETTSYKRVGYANRPVVVGKLKGAGGGRSLILNGHIDTVSHEPADRWTRDPFGGEVVDDKLYGRGSCDMKAGVAAMITAVRCVQQLGIRLKGDVLLNTVPEEEDGGVGGALATIVRGHTADGAIVTESCHPDRIIVANGGVRYFKIRITGRTHHAAYAHAGVNAIGKGMKIFEALVQLNKYRQRTIRNPLFEYPGTPGNEYADPGTIGHTTTINIGKIYGGDWPSTVAGWVEMEGRVGWSPPETREDVMNSIEGAIQRAAWLDPWMRENPPTIEWMGWDAQASQQDVNHPLPQTVKRCAEQLGYGPITFAGFPGGNDDRWFRLQGRMPSIIYGAEGGQAHGIDEYVVISSLVKATKVLTLAILDWCGSA